MSRIYERIDLKGAYCEPCRGAFQCATCKERPFGSAPCLDTDEKIDCPECPNQEQCTEIAEREWPLAELALEMAEGRYEY